MLLIFENWEAQLQVQMSSLRVRWAHNGGYVTFSSSLNSETHSCMGWTRYFSRQVNKNFLTVHKPHQQIAQRHRFRLGVAANRGYKCNSMNIISNSSSFDHLIRSDGTCVDWSEISNVRTKKRIIDKEDDNSKKLDQWMRDSVVEIVSNIGGAPLLVHIYSDDVRKESSSKAAIRLVIEKAVAESWPIIRGRWDGGSPTPNGVILVEELKSKEVVISLDEEKRNDIGTNSQLHSTTRIWGVLIQAKGLNCSACYILKTCRVQTFLGFCTHFCLLRVECFAENAEIQLKKLWLQR